MKKLKIRFCAGKSQPTVLNKNFYFDMKKDKTFVLPDNLNAPEWKVIKRFLKKVPKPKVSGIIVPKEMYKMIKSISKSIFDK